MDRDSLIRQQIKAVRDAVTYKNHQDNLAKGIFSLLQSCVGPYLENCKSSELSEVVKSGTSQCSIKAFGHELSFDLAYVDIMEDGTERLTLQYEDDRSEFSGNLAAFFDEVGRWQVIMEDGTPYEMDKNFEFRVLEIITNFIQQASDSFIEKYIP